MRPTLFWKMFLLQLLAAAAVLAGVLLVTRAVSMRGFAEYLEQRQHAQVQEMSMEVAHYYRQSGDLPAAFDWVAVLHRHAPADPQHVHEAPMPPLQLQDASGAAIGGDGDMPTDRSAREPIVIDGATVGYLAWAQLPAPGEAEFAHKFGRHITRILPVALAVAALFAALITGLIVKPIRSLSAGAGALARREFGTRLPEDRRDELGQLAADFNRLAASLEGYESRQKQWLADVAHELRTPLAVLRGEVDALLEGIRTFGPGTVRSLSEEVKRLEVLIEDLHLVSLAESGGLRLNRAPTELAQVLANSVSRFSERFERAGFTLRASADPGLTANVDSQRLDQVLANLLENALRHAKPGLVTISAVTPAPSVTPAKAGVQSSGIPAFAGMTGVLISVADSGPGVPPDALPKLFDRLYRADPSRVRAVGGAGLGLAICKSIVEAHGGTIEAVKSAAGGLEILIRLPRESGGPVDSRLRGNDGGS